VQAARREPGILLDYRRRCGRRILRPKLAAKLQWNCGGFCGEIAVELAADSGGILASMTVSMA